MGIINKFFGEKKKTIDELKAEVLKKATENYSALSDLEEAQVDVIKESKSAEDISQLKNKNIRTVLLELAKRGETGALPKSVSDRTGINIQDISTALTYLTKNNYAELVVSPTGDKFYITADGKKYSVSKEFNA